MYFHLRFTEVSARVDRAFQQQQGQTQTQPAEEKKDDDAVGQQLTHPAFVAVWRELKGLWAPSVFLAPLTPRLFKLALQIVGRFHHWCVCAAGMHAPVCVKWSVMDEGLHYMHTRILTLSLSLSLSHTQHPRLDEALTQAVTTTPYPSSPAPNLLPADQPEALVAFAWDAVVFSGEPAVKHLVALALQAVAAARAEEGQEQGGEGEVGRLLEEGLAEAMAPFAGLAMRAWELLHERVVGQCVTALQGVKGVTATYRMTNKRPPERACPYVGKVLDPLRALEPEVKGRCVAVSSYFLVLE